MITIKQKVHFTCGKAGCRCQATPPELHGPYYQWTRKVASKTVGRWLSPEQAADYQVFIENHRRLREAGKFAGVGRLKLRWADFQTLTRQRTFPAPVCDDFTLRRLALEDATHRRQVFDLPPLRFEVTEHQVWAATCACGQVCRGEFPEGVCSPVQYGPAALAAAGHLTQHHMMPVQRTSDLMDDVFGLPMAEATVLAASQEAGVRLTPTVGTIGQALQVADVAHADETGLRVAGSLHWMHVLATTLLTWVACHAKRGKQAFDALDRVITSTDALLKVTGFATPSSQAASSPGVRSSPEASRKKRANSVSGSRLR